MTRNTGDIPVRVFEGDPTETAILSSLLESAKIATHLTGPASGAPEALYVRRSDEAAAREIVADFETKRGRGGGCASG